MNQLKIHIPYIHIILTFTRTHIPSVKHIYVCAYMNVLTNFVYGYSIYLFIVRWRYDSFSDWKINFMLKFVLLSIDS